MHSLSMPCQHISGNALSKQSMEIFGASITKKKMFLIPDYREITNYWAIDEYNIAATNYWL